MSFLKWFLGVQDTHPASHPGQQPAPPRAGVGEHTAQAGNAQAYPQVGEHTAQTGNAQAYPQVHEPTPAEVIAEASIRLGQFADTVPPRALFPAFEMVETYRKITDEAGSNTHRALPETTSYTLQTALSTYLPNLFTAYTRTHSPTETQTTELVQALTEANREFSTALNLVRAGHSMDLETHTLFMRKRMVA